MSSMQQLINNATGVSRMRSGSRKKAMGRIATAMGRTSRGGKGH